MFYLIFYNKTAKFEQKYKKRQLLIILTNFENTNIAITNS